MHLVAKCPSGGDYVGLSLAFDSVSNPPEPGSFVGFAASTSTYAGQVGDGSVNALVGVNLDPGDYVVRAECAVERTPSLKVFAPFDITVTGPKSRVERGEKEWAVILRGRESEPESHDASECWKHDGLIALVTQTIAGYGNAFTRPDADVVSVQPVIAGSSGCRDL